MANFNSNNAVLTVSAVTGFFFRTVRAIIRQTGNQIGKRFETKLMLDQSIYNKARELGIVIGYEYDGMSLYAKDNEACEELLTFIQHKGSELLGINLVFVRKDHVSVKQLLLESEIETLSGRIAEKKGRLRLLRGKCWRIKNWKPYYAASEKLRQDGDSLQRLVSDYETQDC